MQVCVSPTPAQAYHMLRRQALHGMRRPLVVVSPKPLLRHPLTVSGLEELASGTFLPVIGEIDELDPKGMKRIVVYSGRVCHNLLEQRRKNNQHDIAIVHVGQLYPFPHEVVQEVLQQFAHAKDFIWCQEEPLNQGVWYCSRYHFREVTPFGASLRYTDHPASASPAIGYMSAHQKQQQDLVSDALNVE